MKLPLRRAVLWALAAVILQSAGHCNAAKVIGFSATGALSHQAALARIGVELAERGHDFKLLVSKHDTLTQARLLKSPFEAVKLMKFNGPADGGDEQWLRDLPRNPSEVLSAQLVSHHKQSRNEITRYEMRIRAIHGAQFFSLRC